MDNSFNSLDYTSPQNIVSFYRKGVDHELAHKELKVRIIYYIEIKSNSLHEEFTFNFKEIHPKMERRFCYVKARYYKYSKSVKLITDYICVEPCTVRNYGIGTFLLNKIVVWAKNFKNVSVLPIWIKDLDQFTELRKSFYNKFGLESELVEEGTNIKKLYTKQIDVSELKENDLNVNSATKMYIEESVDEYVEMLHQKSLNYVVQLNDIKEKNSSLSKQNKHQSEENKKLSNKIKCYKKTEFILNLFHKILMFFIQISSKLISFIPKSRKSFSVNLTVNSFFKFSIIPCSFYFYKFYNDHPIVFYCCLGTLAVNFEQIILGYRRFNYYFDNYISFRKSKLFLFKFDYLSRFMLAVNLVCSYMTISAVINGLEPIVTAFYFLILLLSQLLLLDINYQTDSYLR